MAYHELTNMNFLKTFRGRLLVILAVLLIATLGVQYYLNLETERQNEQLREQQTQALVAGIALGFRGATSDDRMQDLIKKEGQKAFDERTINRMQDIIIINDNWSIEDSLNDAYLPTEDEKGNLQKKSLMSLKGLPPLMEAERLGADRAKFPNAVDKTDDDSGEAYAIPIETNQGRWYVMVVLKTDKGEIFRRAAQSLIYTLAIPLVALLITVFLVWRFTRPVANLSEAARRVAEGDLRVRVADENRSDEMGVLAARFNEMTAELAKKQELETKLQEAEKSAVVGRLGSAIAHEIRNPLNYINLSLDHLRAKFAPVDADKRAGFEKLTAQLKTEVARINRQITDFLSYSRPAKANLQPLDARKVVEDSLRIVEAQAAEQNIKISLIERENVPLILGDAEFLRSVFNNLFINAVHATETGGGNLNVTISPDQDFVKIEIFDAGRGIPAENLPKIFEPYFSTKETGTGLGLAIVKKVIDIHNGAIDVASKEKEGTKFTVRLPKAEDQPRTNTKI
ncbi:MAG: ATP-binding protein [Pyrinomonadaceae bacterium]